MTTLRDAAQQALGALETVLSDAYHRRFPECCGRPGSECCGNPNEAWTPEDNKIMDLLSPAQRQLSDALRAALTEHPEQEPGNWIVYNAGAEVASGLSLAEALEYLTPERLARQWCAVCVVDQSNLPKTPQPAKQPLTDEEIYECERIAAIRYHRHKNSIRGQQITPADDPQWHFARAIIATYERKNGIGEQE